MSLVEVVEVFVELIDENIWVGSFNLNERIVCIFLVKWKVDIVFSI